MTQDRGNRQILPDAVGTVLAALLFLFFLDVRGTDALCLAGFLLNGAVILVCLLLALRRAGVSLELSYWMFMAVFFFVAPLIQYTEGDFPWVRQRYPDDILLAANRSLLVWNLIVALMLHVRRGPAPPSAVSVQTERVSGRFCRLATALSLLIALLFLARNGVTVIGASRLDSTALLSADESSVRMLLNKGMAAYVLSSAAISWFYLRQCGEKRCFVLSLLALLVCLFPTRLARYLSAAVYGCLLLLLLPGLWKGQRFFRFFAVAVLLLFPLVDVFRTAGLFEADLPAALRQLLRQYPDSYLQGHYDAYSMLCGVIRAVRQQGISGGRQLLGALLFFIPRRFWPAKPIGSGAMVSYALGYAFHNVSCPLIGEAILNFGVPGLIAGAALVGLLLRRVDERAQRGESSLLFGCLYPVMIFFVFFLLRGDLMSSYSYFMAFFAVFAGMSRINRRFVQSEG